MIKRVRAEITAREKDRRLVPLVDKFCEICRKRPLDRPRENEGLLLHVI